MLPDSGDDAPSSRTPARTASPQRLRAVVVSLGRQRAAIATLSLVALAALVAVLANLLVYPNSVLVALYALPALVAALASGPRLVAFLAAAGLALGLLTLSAADMSGLVGTASLGTLGLIGVVAIGIAQQRRQMLARAGSAEQRMQQLHHLARHDALTDLPNRAEFLERLEEAMERSRSAPDEQFAVLFIDCDDFKEVNDTHGHAVGDAVLRVLARRLRSALRAEDIAARLGGDEFALLLRPVDSPDRARQVIQRLESLLADAYVLGGVSVHVTVSIGLALSSTGYERSADMLHAADVSMYSEKGTLSPYLAGPVERAAIERRTGLGGPASDPGRPGGPERRSTRRSSRAAPRLAGELALAAARQSSRTAPTAPTGAPADASVERVLAEIDAAVRQLERRVALRRVGQQLATEVAPDFTKSAFAD
jgi:diguanylate cyclase (GGDEF)-like protein